MVGVLRMGGGENFGGGGDRTDGMEKGGGGGKRGVEGGGEDGEVGWEGGVRYLALGV